VRVGQNPAKFIDHVSQPQPITVAVIVYIPFLHGYYTQSLEVLKTCLESLWENTPQTYDLLVFDNASCPEVRAYLQQMHEQDRIQYLVLSNRNVGKGGGWNLIFQGAPGEIIAYADSDVYFYPGWLEKSLQIIEKFPKAGMVTARPLRTPEVFYTATQAWAEQTPDASMETGSFMSWELFKEHTDSLGVSDDKARELYGSTVDQRVTYNGIQAQMGAAHFQFIASKAVLEALGAFEMDRPMGQVRSLDKRLNDSGYLRLSTTERLCKHMGNRIETAGNEKKQRSTSPARRLRNLPPIRRSLLWLYDRIFRLYYS
jgi:glycosyltransferase involved in cell wall biosynthesis